MNEIVSVIIPVFNRYNLIKETLDSILKQTYQNWECIVVDDQSEDETLAVLNIYKKSKATSKLKIYERPDHYPKGANSCRNYGFEKSSGDYIIWFDSDDLMTPNHIEKKLRVIKAKKLDFIVARTQNFQNSEFLEPYFYERKNYGIRASDFILLKIHWYTYDVMLRRDLAMKIKWNEQMKSWQDYNYFCKMLLISEKGEYLDLVLTHRRLHPDSIQKSLTTTIENFNRELLENRLFTYWDINKDLDVKTRIELIFGMMNISFELARLNEKSQYIGEVSKIVKMELGRISKNVFEIALITARISRKGYLLLNKAKGK
ncbi:glycosyltransferase family 2 protein [Christiangramia aquimixticola]|uniref:glycosyltransferase family 2 protein n=1 Tax=Christiangramia aquimixticola TaxID=1697558 RepID=UPI003AA8A439